jgi:hypothetical protein
MSQLLRFRGVLPAAIALYLVFAPGCGEEFSSSEGAGGGSAAASTAVATSTGQGGAPMCDGLGDPCSGCMAASCPGEACRCWDSPDCMGLYDCYETACGGNVDVMCAKLCMSLNEAGVSLGVLFGDCASTTCASNCGQTPGDPLTACQRCLYQKCAPQMNDCLADNECYDYLVCTDACTSTACILSCGRNFPSEAARIDAIRMCAAANCPTCG